MPANEEITKYLLGENRSGPRRLPGSHKIQFLSSELTVLVTDGDKSQLNLVPGLTLEYSEFSRVF